MNQEIKGKNPTETKTFSLNYHQPNFSTLTLLNNSPAFLSLPYGMSGFDSEFIQYSSQSASNVT